MSKFRAVVAGLQIELRKGIGRRTHDKAGAVQEIDEIRVVVHTIEDEVVLFSALAVCNKIARPAATGISEWRSHASRQLSNIYPVAAIKGRVVDGFRANDLSHSAFLRLK